MCWYFYKFLSFRINFSKFEHENNKYLSIIQIKKQEMIEMLLKTKLRILANAEFGNILNPNYLSLITFI